MKWMYRSLIKQLTGRTLPAVVALLLAAILLFQLYNQRSNRSQNRLAGTDAISTDCFTASPLTASTPARSVVEDQTTRLTQNAAPHPSASPTPYPWPAFCESFLRRVTAPTVHNSLRSTAMSILKQFNGDQRRVDELTQYLLEHTSIAREPDMDDLDRYLGWMFSDESWEEIVEEYHTEDREAPRTEKDRTRMQEFNNSYFDRSVKSASYNMCTILKLDVRQQNNIRSILSKRQKAKRIHIPTNVSWHPGGDNQQLVDELAKRITKGEKLMADRRSLLLAELKPILTPEQLILLTEKLTLADSSVASINSLISHTE